MLLKTWQATGFTIYDNTTCIGCHSCAMACPFGAPSFSKKGKMQKCDGCRIRIGNGLEPACVRTCPTHALTCTNEQEYHQMHRKRSLNHISNKLL
ncbi:4Fe-4S dicluster domain-containing protein [Hydrogenoanaerobacterium sp.]|uniref:4Fe-4S dicluster domain-containing protein n=1 Tax=Hydrogenoanaerobacterium sp. TaxID=2953763 RepID=UPI0028A0E816|nr:4Fe-4S dicluster domain-containing protein [Hydrogenoanaerobacterium sp.]